MWDEPSIGFIDDQAWLLLRDEDQTGLCHMQMREGKWVELERSEGILGEDLRVIGKFTINAYASPMELTVCCEGGGIE